MKPMLNGYGNSALLFCKCNDDCRSYIRIYHIYLHRTKITEMFCRFVVERQRCHQPGFSSQAHCCAKNCCILQYFWMNSIFSLIKAICTYLMVIITSEQCLRVCGVQRKASVFVCGDMCAMCTWGVEAPSSATYPLRLTVLSPFTH